MSAPSSNAGGTIYMTGTITTGTTPLSLDTNRGTWKVQGGTISSVTINTSGAQCSGAATLNFTSHLDNVTLNGDLGSWIPGAAVIATNSLTLNGQVYGSGSLSMSGAGVISSKRPARYPLARAPP